MSDAVTPELLQSMPLPEPGDGGKEERGRVLVVAGSREVPGAALLAGEAALRVGAGKLQIHTAQSVAVALGIALPEAMCVGSPETEAGSVAAIAAPDILKKAKHCSALLIGPGLVNDAATHDLVAALLGGVEDCPILLDAAAMMRLPELRERLRPHRGRIVVTPHAGEMAGMLGRDKAMIEADPAGTAREVAADLGVVAVLKGACTFIAGPGEEARSCSHGNPGLGTSGSGDTLAGLITGLLARGAEPVQAAIWGVYLHGEAGHRLARSRGPLGYLAREIPGEVPRILAEVGRMT